MEKNDLDIFVVNLDRRPDRLQTFWNSCPTEWREVVQRVSAVDGLSLSGDKLVPGEERRLGQLSPGETGCFLSHAGIWQRVAKGTRPALVFEDDTKFPPGFLSRFETTVLPALPGLLSRNALLYVGGRDRPGFVTDRRFTEKDDEKGIERFLGPTEQGGGTVLAGNYHVDRTTHAYILSPGMAAHLTNRLGQQCARPVDKFMRHTCLLSGPVLTCNPLLCYSPLLTSDTDCQPGAGNS